MCWLEFCTSDSSVFSKSWKWYKNTQKQSCLAFFLFFSSVKQKPKLFCNTAQTILGSSTKIIYRHHCYKHMEQASTKHCYHHDTNSAALTIRRPILLSPVLHFHEQHFRANPRQASAKPGPTIFLKTEILKISTISIQMVRKKHNTAQGFLEPPHSLNYLQVQPGLLVFTSLRRRCLSLPCTTKRCAGQTSKCRREPRNTLSEHDKPCIDTASDGRLIKFHQLHHNRVTECRSQGRSFVDLNSTTGAGSTSIHVRQGRKVQHQ